MASILVNGTAQPLAPEQTLAELVASLALGQQAVAVAVDRRVVPRPQWAGFRLQPGQQIDIVRAIGGG
ncbi:sulfur carrier protein ThiS [Massilia sp. TS11]|uniref:sulfur carrier protein ThiS n=1 Tax=Massilia sp. TS11 TaxID=2908003 RepID=UPI001EDB46D3|nr:sulfur carrier protein ThiS [Massilia sp. TS11]MCG2585412.1 sulfur carrier protein ThiS [Massilia sp. TS11]